ncbi:calbindin-32 isoform X4 [Panulirus ornatus]|uniref:calbindin-32 isoform X4 n=1 Tax=Panulirus ornatus TaxID=150431 RepID=UPI003A86796F
MAAGTITDIDYQRKMNSQEKCNNFMRQFRDDESRELKKLTANQFMEVWSHYDADGNGYIEGSELDGFLKEFVSSVNANDAGPESVSDTMLAELKECFMEAYDDNQDGKIEIRELAQLLPMEENFLLLFRFDNPLESSVEFMKIWKQYDADHNGFIDSNELKNFLRDLLKEAKKDQDVSEDKLIEYTDTMLQVFDQNKDGKLQLSEMAKLLPVKENFLCRSVFKGASKLTKEDIERVFALYDRDNNGTIENEELNGFLKDLLELVKKDYDALDLQEFQDAIMRGCDFNKDGKINKKELTMILLALAKHGAEDEMQTGMGLAANNPLAEIATMGIKALKLQKLRVRHFVNRTLGTTNSTS